MTLDKIVEELNIEDLGYIVRKVMEKKEAYYFGSVSDMDNDEEFIITAMRGNKDSKYSKVLKTVIGDMYGKVPEKEGLDRNFLIRNRID